MESFKIKGSLEILVHQKGVLVDSMEFENIIVNIGKSYIANRIAYSDAKIVARMAIGDMGALPSDTTVPRIPTIYETTLYHEVYRQDIQTLTINTTSTPPAVPINEVVFSTVFSAMSIPSTSYVNSAAPMVNEIGLVVVDTLATPTPPPTSGAAAYPGRPPVAAPNPQWPGETLFSIKTFKSIPFEAANETTISVRYTVSII